MAPHLRCKCIWALATLGYNPSSSWLSQLAASAFDSADVSKLTPGDFTDALWGLFTLETQQQQGAAEGVESSQAPAELPASNTSSSSVLSLQLMQALDSKLYKRVQELLPAQVLRLLELGEGATERVPGYRLPSGIGEQMSATLSARATAISDLAGVLKLAWAAANLELPLHGSAKDHICRKLYGQLDSLSASDMARGFWASAKLRYG